MGKEGRYFIFVLLSLVFLASLAIISLSQNASAVEPNGKDAWYLDDGSVAIKDGLILTPDEYEEYDAEFPGTSKESTGTTTVAPPITKPFEKVRFYLDKIFGFIGVKDFTDNTKLNVAYFLMILLVFGLVFGVAEYMPFFPDSGKTFFKILFAAVVSVLAFLFVTPSMVRSMVETFTALGVALVTIIPLLILITMNIEIAKKSDHYNIVNKVLISLFIVYLIVAWVQGIGLRANANATDKSILDLVYPITLIVSVIWLFASNSVYRQIARLRRKKDFAGANNRLAEHLQNRLDGLYDELSHIDVGASNAEKREAALKKEIESLEKRIGGLRATA